MAIRFGFAFVNNNRSFFICRIQFGFLFRALALVFNPNSWSLKFWAENGKKTIFFFGFGNIFSVFLVIIYLRLCPISGIQWCLTSLALRFWYQPLIKNKYRFVIATQNTVPKKVRITKFFYLVIWGCLTGSVWIIESNFHKTVKKRYLLVSRHQRSQPKKERTCMCGSIWI